MRKLVAKPLGQLLIENKLISQEQLDKALAMQRDKGGLLGEILVSAGFTSEEAIARMLTVQYGFAFLLVAGYRIDLEVARLIPEEVARRHVLVAVDKIGSFLTVAMSNPLNQQAVDEVEKAAKLKIQACISTATDILAAINRVYKT